MATPPVQLPVATPSLPVQPPQVPSVPTHQTCLVQIGLFVNGMNKGIVGQTRSHFTYTVQANWCQSQFALLFSSLSVRVDFSPDAHAFTVKLTPETSWITQVVVPYADGDNYWLHDGDTTFTAKVTDFALVGGVALPKIQPSWNFVPGSRRRFVPAGPVSTSQPLVQSPLVGYLAKKVPSVPIPSVPTPPNPPSPPDVPVFPPPSTSVDVLVPTPPSTPVPSLPTPSFPNLPQPSDIVTSNATLFPPTSFTGTVKAQLTTLALAAPDVFADETPIVYTLLSAYQDTSPDRIVGTLTATYDGKQGQTMQKSATTMSYTEASTLDDVGRAIISLGTDIESDLRYGTHDVKVYFDGIEIINGNKGLKKVKTCEPVNGVTTVVVNRRDTTLMVQLS